MLCACLTSSVIQLVNKNSSAQLWNTKAVGPARLGFWFTIINARRVFTIYWITSSPQVNTAINTLIIDIYSNFVVPIIKMQWNVVIFITIFLFIIAGSLSRCVPPIFPVHHIDFFFGYFRSNSETFCCFVIFFFLVQELSCLKKKYLYVEEKGLVFTAKDTEGGSSDCSQCLWLQRHLVYVQNNATRVRSFWQYLADTSC